MVLLSEELREKFVPSDEEAFPAFMAGPVAGWLKDEVKSGQFESFDGKKIQYYLAVRKDAKAVLIMVHGFCEFFGKFHEAAYNFYQAGYTVCFLEQRGHGGSFRSVPNPDHVDIDDFRTYVRDLKALTDKVVSPVCGSLPLFLYAHSMGGCVGALALEAYPELFDAAVLTSPMLKMSFGSIPLWQVRGLLFLSRLMHWDEKTMPGQLDFDPEKPDFENSAALSRARFDYQFRLRTDPSTDGMYTMNAGTYRWGRAAWKATHALPKREAQIRIPVLVCQAGKDAFVDNSGQDEFVRKAQNATLVRFPEAKHEIMNSSGKLLEEYYGTVIGFLDSQTM